MTQDFERFSTLLHKPLWTDNEKAWFQTFIVNHGQEDRCIQLLRDEFFKDVIKSNLLSPAHAAEIKQDLLGRVDQTIFDGKGLSDFRENANVKLNEFGYNSKKRFFTSESLKFCGSKRVGVGLFSFMLLGLTVILFLQTKKPFKNNVAYRVLSSPNSIVPGTARAMLRLQDQSVSILDSAGSTLIIQQADVTVENVAGCLIYRKNKNTIADHSGNGSSGIIPTNILTTPRGGQHQIILEDGTRIWLNAASSLMYPVTFTGKERNVTLTGEAYFEVAKNKEKPFHVYLQNGLLIEVLGTHFDVMAYEDEASVNTTLREGSVRLSFRKQQVKLEPGQQVSLSDSNQILMKSKPDMDQVFAWQRGVFQFDKMNIQGIMRQIARWYDVDIKYTGILQRQLYSGTISRQEDIKSVLKILEYTGTIHFSVEGRSINIRS